MRVRPEAGVRRGGTSRVLTGALAFEWTKLWSVRSTPGTLLLGAVLAAALGVVLGASAAASAANGYDVAEPAPHLAARCLQLAQVAVVLLAATAVAGEHATGTMTTTVLAVPRRGLLLLAKTLVVTGVSAASGTLLVLLATAVVAPLMGRVGAFTAAELASTAAGGGAYCALLAATTLGVGAATRSTAATLVGVSVALLLAPPVLSGTSLGRLADAGTYLPGAAALPLMTRLGEPYGATTALVVLLLWAVAGAGLGWARLQRHDV